MFTKKIDQQHWLWWRPDTSFIDWCGTAPKSNMAYYLYIFEYSNSFADICIAEAPTSAESLTITKITYVAIH